MSDSNDDAAPRRIWTLGDRWRDLRDEVRISDHVAAIESENGTIRIVDSVGGLQSRIPRAASDLRLLPPQMALLTAITVANPCGAVLWGRGPHSWSATTRIVAVWIGVTSLEIPTTEPIDRAALERLADGHPPTACGAPHCLLQEGLWSPPAQPGATRTRSVIKDQYRQ